MRLTLHWVPERKNTRSAATVSVGPLFWPETGAPTKMLRRSLAAAAAMIAIACGDPASPDGDQTDNTSVVAKVELSASAIGLGIGATQTQTATAKNAAGSVISGQGVHVDLVGRGLPGRCH